MLIVSASCDVRMGTKDCLAFEVLGGPNVYRTFKDNAWLSV